jgi:hypothetical protein
LCPSPGINALTVFPLVNLTLAHFLNAELGFFGFKIMIRNTTPLRNGLFCKSGDFVTFGFSGLQWVPLRIWWIDEYRNWVMIGEARRRRLFVLVVIDFM